MSDIRRLVEYLVPLLFPEGPGPFWVSVGGTFEGARPELWADDPPTEDEVYFDLFAGDFDRWEPGPGCRAVVVVAPCTTNAKGHLYLRKLPGAPPAVGGWRRGVIYFGLSREGDQYAIEVGDDGPRTAGSPSSGAFVDAVRAKFGLAPLPAEAGPSPWWALELT